MHSVWKRHIKEISFISYPDFFNPIIKLLWIIVRLLTANGKCQCIHFCDMCGYVESVWTHVFCIVNVLVVRHKNDVMCWWAEINKKYENGRALNPLRNRNRSHISSFIIINCLENIWTKKERKKIDRPRFLQWESTKNGNSASTTISTIRIFNFYAFI